MKSLVFGALVAAGLAVSGARAGVIEQFEVEDWSGIAYADDQSGAFHNCIVFAGYRNGGTLMMIRTVENSWALTIAHDDLKLTPGESYELQYRVDRRRPVKVDAEALNADQLTIAADNRLMDQIRRGNEFKVSFEGKEYRFELSNSGKAVKAAQECVDRHRGTVHQAAAPEPAAKPADSTEAAPKETAQASAPPATSAPSGSETPQQQAGSERTPLEIGTAQIGSFEVPGWTGVVFGDAAGQFASCGIVYRYQNDAAIWFLRTADDELLLGVIRFDWKLQPGEWSPMSYKVRWKVPPNDLRLTEMALTRRAEAYASDKITLLTDISRDEQFVDGLKKAEALEVEAQGDAFALPLSNVVPGLEAIEECRETRVATAASPTEAPAAPAGPAAQSGKAAPPVETAQADQPATEPAAPEAAETDAQEPADDSSASTLGERQNFGHWVVTATDDGAGNFVNCTAFGVYSDDEQLILSYTPEGKWEFGLYRADWSLPTDASYFLWYNVDRSVEEPGVMKRPVEAVEPTRIFFEVSALETLMERAATGQQLNLQLRGPGMEPQSLSYSLDQAGAAFQATKACVARHQAQADSLAASDDVVVEPEASEAAEAAPAEPSESAQAAQPEQQANAGPSLPPIGGEKTETLDVPGWEGGAYTDDSGAFTHCAISADYQNGSTLGFARTADNSLLIAVARSDWELEPREWSPIRYSFGKAYPISNEGEAQAVNSELLATNMGRNNMFLEELKQSPELKVEVQGRSLSFDISDLAPGLEAIDECKERHLAAAERPATDAAPEADAADETGTLEEFKVEDWNAAAYRSDSGGLSHCAAFATYQNGLTLYLVKLASGNWRIGLMNPGKWTLDQSSTVPVQYQIDSHPEREVEGIPTAESTLVIDVDASVMRDEVAAGKELVTGVEGERFAFDLGNADKAIPAVEQCVARHGGEPLKPSRKASAEPKVETATAAQDTPAVEGRRYIANLLTRAGYPEHHIMVGDDVPDGFQGYDAVWEIGEIRGMLRIQPEPRQLTPTQARDQITASDRKHCKGEFSTTSLTGGAGDEGILFATTCKEADWAYRVAYSVVPRPQGGSYIISHMGLGDGEAALAIAGKVHATALL